ncbi:MAG: ORF6N domain-containing protein [Pyrinomonadaceae bacterium]
MTGTILIPAERIERTIYLIRGEKVMLDRDLAELYGVETRIVNRAVKRNLNRFPEDFMFQLRPKKLPV